MDGWEMAKSAPSKSNGTSNVIRDRLANVIGGILKVFKFI